MNRFRATIPALVVFTAALNAQMYPATWKLAHPDAKALIGVDLRNLRESQVGKSFGSQIDKSGMGMFLLPAMDLLNDIDEVLISSPGGKTVKPKQNPPFLAVLTGHFAPEHVRKVFGRPARVYGTFDIYGSAETAVALLDAHTIVLGDEKSVQGGIDRMSHHPSGSSELLARAFAMAADHDFWLISTVSPSEFQPPNVAFSPIASQIEGLDAGLSLREGLQFEVDLSTKSPETAKQMALLLSTQLKSAPMPQGAEALQKLDVTSDGPRMSMKIALNQAEVEQMVRTMQASQHTVTSQRPPPVEQGPKTIKIFGLDEGVKEIPLGSASRN